jgi:hypothetical protein
MATFTPTKAGMFHKQETRQGDFVQWHISYESEQDNNTVRHISVVKKKGKLVTNVKFVEMPEAANPSLMKVQLKQFILSVTEKHFCKKKN